MDRKRESARKKCLAILAGICAAGVLWGCGFEPQEQAQGASIGEDGVIVQMHVVSQSHARARARRPEQPRRPLLFSDPDGTLFSLTRASLGIDSVLFEFQESLNEAEQPCEDLARQASTAAYQLDCGAGTLSVQGPLEVDLISGEIRRPAHAGHAEATVNLAAGPLPSLDYRRVQVDFGDTSWARLRAAASFELHASIYELIVDFSLPPRVKQAVLTPGDLRSGLLLALNIGVWLHRIPVAYCAMHGYLDREGDRFILSQELDAAALAYFNDSPPLDCRDAQERFWGNFERSLEVYAN